MLLFLAIYPHHQFFTNQCLHEDLA